MRDFARKSPTFWTRGTGKKLRGHKDAQILADYLTSAPTHNAIGLYSVGIPNICHETGLSFDEALTALALLERLGFAVYDHEEEVVWIKTMVLWQFGVEPGDTLKMGSKDVKGDNKIRSILKDLINAPRHPFVRSFFDAYGVQLGLGEAPEWVRSLPPWTGVGSPPSEGQSGTLVKGTAVTLGEGVPHPLPGIAIAEQERSKSVAGANDRPAASADVSDTDVIASTIRSLPIFAALDADAIAVAYELEMFQRRQRAEWVTQSIRDCAQKTAGMGLKAEALQSKLLSFMKHSKGPKVEPGGPTPSDIRAERTAAVQLADLAKAEGRGR